MWDYVIRFSEYHMTSNVVPHVTVFVHHPHYLTSVQAFTVLGKSIYDSVLRFREADVSTPSCDSITDVTFRDADVLTPSCDIMTRC